ncbi:methyl-accepting chemotaxis protein [Bacillus sp. BML-BC060]|uniref:methyl-accepting chemotaxis protein n=1 Tax=Bacillus sp. BML-BC060 TaxID=2842487 RepID=UPI0021800C82|nr:methyl-accepting chemotaxis protein [Bacillus sp. BML-BC060]
MKEELLQKRNKIMFYLLIFIAISNVIVCFAIGKPLTLMFSILGSTLFVCFVMFLLLKTDKQLLGSYWYTFGINSIVLVYITLDKNIGDVLFLFVTIIMTTIYLDKRINIFATVLSMLLFLHSFFALDLFEKQYDLLFYYLFSFFCFGIILSYVSHFVSTVLQDLLTARQTLFEQQKELISMNQTSKKTIYELKKFSSTLKNNVKIISDKNHDFNQSLEEIVHSFVIQTDNLERITLNTTNIQEESNIIFDLSKEVHSKTTECSKSITEYTKETEKLDAAIEDLKELFSQNEDVNDTLVQKLNDIESITDTLNKISNQTKMLSLNASIEAARAGEHGKGFTIVSHEMKKLSETSNLFTNNIQQIILDIKELISKNDDFFKHSYDCLHITNQNSNTVKQIFELVSTNSKEMEQEIKKVFEHTSVLKTNVEDINQSLVELQSVTEEHAASNEEIKSNFENHTENVQKIYGDFNDLKIILEENINND